MSRLIVILVLGLLLSCATQSQLVNESYTQFRQIKKDMQRESIYKMIGYPTRIEENGSTELWRVKEPSSNQFTELTVNFDSDGKAVGVGHRILLVK